MTKSNAVTMLEAEYYRTLNLIVEPVVRAGCGPTGIVPIGLIVLETKGWRTGRLRRTTVLASAIDDLFLVSTVRGRRSHWVKNLSHNAEMRYWNGDQPHQATAIVFAPDEDIPKLEGWPALFSSLAAGFASPVKDFGCAFALLAPTDSHRDVARIGPG